MTTATTTPISTTRPMVPIAGIHHVTAIAGDPQRNLDFYAGTLGLRLVKKTVNFDDPGTYHLYFGDEDGTPGTIFTTFPWPRAKRGTRGVGSQVATAFAVPAGSLNAWRTRLAGRGVEPSDAFVRFGQRVIAFEDHDGMSLELIETAEMEAQPFWTHGGVSGEMAIRRLHSATLSVASLDGTLVVLRDVMGMVVAGTEGNRTRMAFGATADRVAGQCVDLIASPEGRHSSLGAGIVHHLAFRARSDEEQERWRRLLEAKGIATTSVRDRNYFRSIYFREPGGVLFEIATDQPGFAVDESKATLGEALKLPREYEHARARLEVTLPPIAIPRA